MRKFLELLRRYVFPEDFALDVFHSAGEELHHVAARLQNIEGFVREDKRHVRARKQRIEKGTRAHAILKVFFDKPLEEDSCQ